MPSRFVRVGNDQLLEARYIVGGKSPDTYDYFWFGKTGATLVDFRPIVVAANSVLQAGKRVLRLDYEADDPGTHGLWNYGNPLRSRLGVTNENDRKWSGIVDVEFKIERGHVITTKASYDPDARIDE
jgi:hypothetical protein